MKKMFIYMFFFISLMFFFMPNASAIDNSQYGDTKLNNTSLIQVLDCDSSGAALGNVNDPDSVAWLLQKILNYVRVIAPVLVLVLSSLDYVKAIFGSDDESLTASHKKLITRLVLVAVLFLLPTLVGVLLDVLGFVSTDTCVS